MKRILLIIAVLAASLAAGAAFAGETGLFTACYNIGGQMPGAPLFHTSLAVNTPTESLSGMGRITQAVNPPLDIHTRLRGDFTYMTVMPKNTHILIVATGYPMVHWPSHSGVGPVLPPNVHLRMVLSENWKSGTANYSYQNPAGKWTNIRNAPVQMVGCNSK